MISIHTFTKWMNFKIISILIQRKMIRLVILGRPHAEQELDIKFTLISFWLITFRNWWKKRKLKKKNNLCAVQNFGDLSIFRQRTV